MPFAITESLRFELQRALPQRPFSVSFWDGTSLPATGGAAKSPAFVVRSPRAVAHALLAPGQLGLGRAFIAGDLDVDDIDDAMKLLATWSPPAIDRATRMRLMRAGARASGLRLPPRPPAVELRPRGKTHTQARDARAVRHHYDVSNEFFALFLDKSMTYSCGIFSRGATTLEEAQQTKLELVCTKLALNDHDRLLDVGCGWGALAIHAARHHGTRVTAITLSPAQAQEARRRVTAAGLSGLVEIRLADYRELGNEQYDAISSIGMVEHVGDKQIDGYARHLAASLRPGGRLLNHGIARLRHGDPKAGPFSERYVFPDAEPLHLSRVTQALERAGFVTQHVEGFAADYAETLRHWLERLEDNLDEARCLSGPERLRVWQIYLRAARDGFLSGFTGIYQVRAELPEGRNVIPSPRI